MRQYEYIRMHTMHTVYNYIIISDLMLTACHRLKAHQKDKGRCGREGGVGNERIIEQPRRMRVKSSNFDTNTTFPFCHYGIKHTGVVAVEVEDGIFTKSWRRAAL